ncbi:MAG: type II secretory pathway pseudopilin PulG [Oleiphilaceae bacterium]|jgi:type II secretory pathway pseudopilin PulG
MSNFNTAIKSKGRKAVIHQKSKKNGFTFVEVGIAVAIGLTIILGVASGVRTFLQKTDVNDAVRDIQIILQSSADFRSTRPSYTGVSMAVLNAQRLLPDAIGSGVGANPWGGNYTVTANGVDSSKVDIGLSNVPAGISAQLEFKLDPTSDGNNGATVAGTVLTVVY